MKSSKSSQVAVVATLEQRAEESRLLQECIKAMIADEEQRISCKLNWGNWLGNIVAHIKDNLLTDFHQQSFNTVM